MSVETYLVEDAFDVEALPLFDDTLKRGVNKLRICSKDLVGSSSEQQDAPPEGYRMKRRLTRLDSNVQERYQIKDHVLGTGHFACVKKATSNDSGTEVAIKIIDKNLVVRKERLVDEIRMLKDLVGNRHVIKLYDAFEDDDRFYLVMQPALGGELFDRLVAKERYQEDEARIVIRNILEGVAGLHAQNIIHRDLKPENILLVSPDSDTDIRIIDFGLSKFMSDAPEQPIQPARRQRNRAYTCCGTNIYMAPEVHLNQTQGYNFKADAWSVGVISYCILAGYPPFYHERDDKLKALVLSGKYEFYPEEWDAVSHEAKEYVASLLVVDPDKRLSCEDALQLPWFKHEQNLEQTQSTPEVVEEPQAKKD